MNTFKFEITLTDEDLMGDEYWEQAIEEDGMGIATLTRSLADMLDDYGLIMNPDKTGIDCVRLKSYSVGN